MQHKAETAAGRSPASKPAPSSNRRSFWGWPALLTGGLVGLILLFVWPTLLPGRVLMPLDIVTEAWPPWQQPNQTAIVHNPLISDVVDYIYPVKQFTAQAVRNGELPLWNPYVLGGYPFTYNTQAGLFYPLNLFYYLLPGPAAADLIIIVQWCLGALFMILYLRQVGLRPQAVALGAITFTFNGLMVVWLEWQVVHAAIIWLPLQLYFIEKLTTALATRNPKLETRNSKLATRYSLLAAFAFAIPWLGGHWNWSLYGSMTFVVYLLWRLAPLLRPRPSSLSQEFPMGLRHTKMDENRGNSGELRGTLGTRNSKLETRNLFSQEDKRERGRVWDRRVVAVLIGTMAVGVALSLVQVLPAFNYLRQGHRQALPFADSLQQGLLNRLVVLFIPDFFGNPVDHNWWGAVNYNETAFYVGILPLFLALLVPFLRHDRLSLFFLGWGGLGLLWTLGTPVYGLLYILPVFNGLLPSRAAILVMFCTAVLAAMGMDRLVEKAGELVGTQNSKLKTRNFVFIAATLWLLLVAIYAFYYRADVARTWDYLRPQLLLFLLFWLSSGGLLLAWLHGWLTPRWFGGLALVLLTVDLFIAGYGYNTISPTADLYPPTATGRFLLADAEPFRIATLPEGVAYPPNTALTLPVANVSGYEPGILQRMVNFISAAEGEEAIYFERELMPLKGLESPLIDMLNVKYIITIADWHSDVPAVDVAQEMHDTWLTLTPDAPLMQTFQVVDAGLHRVDLWLRPRPTLPERVTVRIFTADGGQELAHADLPGGDIQAEAWHSFYFGTFPSEWGRAFRLVVETAGGEVDVAAASQDAYPGGELVGQAGDLRLRTWYLPRPRLVHEDGKTRIYLNEGYFPRAFAVPQAIIANNEAEALAALQTHTNDLDRVVILEPDAGGELASLSAGQPSAFQPVSNSALSTDPSAQSLNLSISQSPLSSLQSPNPVTITSYTLNRVELTAAMPEPGFVVLADTYYPGWQATLDGEKTPIFRANSIVRAVYVPAGQHTLTFAFRPPDFFVGAGVSGVTLLLCIFVMFRWGWQRTASA